MKRKIILYLSGITLYLSITYLIFLLFNEQTIISLTKEDGFFETLGAVFFLLASILFFIKYLKTKKNLIYLLLAFLFFFGFAEEISWGQRIFNFPTPEVLKGVNIQKEFNIHNIRIFPGDDTLGDRKSRWGLIFNFDRLFSIFWLFYCFLIPVLNKFNSAFSNWLGRIKLPIVPIWLGTFFIINYLISKIMEARFFSHSVIEIKECNFAFLFFTISLYFLFNNKTSTTPLDISPKLPLGFLALFAKYFKDIDRYWE